MPVQPQPGQMIGANVRLVSPLDEGGMGQVWIAEHTTLRSKVVVKFMSEELAATAEGRSRFSREAAAAARVRSPHVVQTLDHGLTSDGVPYIVLELLEGHDLGKHIEINGRMRPAELVQILSQLARALAKVHECGIVHRDIKPSNIFLCDAGGGEVFVKLLDFGIAKSAQADDIAGPLAAKTSTGALMGTPYYMSPEQLAGTREVDHRTDLWSVGVVTFEALTGIKPFNAQSLANLAVQVMRDELPRPSAQDSSLPAAVDDWFAKACARDPAERFHNVREMVDAFAAALGESTPAAVSVPRIVSVPPGSRRDNDHPLASSVSPNATTLHDSGHGLSTAPGLARPRNAMRTGRMIGWGAALFAVGVLAALGIVRLTTAPSPAAGPGQGLAASAVASVPIAATSDSVPIPSAAASETPPPASAAPAPERTAATVTATRPRDAAAPTATAATATATQTAPPVTATATAKKPPVVHPGNEDDIK